MENSQQPANAPFEISIEEISKDFKNHLDIENNKRLIVSGAFGSGKTYFLDKFFTDNPEYEFFHLFPVNYTVSTNEDIFELIKFDILFHLLSKPLDYDVVKINEWFLLESFIYNKPLSFLKSLFGIADKLGQGLPASLGEKLIETYETTAKDFKDYTDSINTDDKQIAINFLKKLTARQGSAKEEDNITILINDLLGKLKKQNKSNPKKIALIIDDLDRIDPEHIFRLLNIFAAHLDVRKDPNLGKGKYQNKFAFDKIIFVCDLRNVRNIFSAKYGSSVDFTGYIDKFYSREVYVYDNTKVLSEKIAEIISSIKVVIPNESQLDIALYTMQSDNLLRWSIIRILLELSLLGIINIRRLEKLANSEYFFDKSVKRFHFNGSNMYDSHYFILNLYNVLIYIFEDSSNLYQALDKASEYNSEYNIGNFRIDEFKIIILRTIIGTCASVLHLDMNRYDFDSDYSKSIFNYTNRSLGVQIDYKIFSQNTTINARTNPSGVFGYADKVTALDTDNIVQRMDLFKLIKLAFQRLTLYRRSD